MPDHRTFITNDLTPEERDELEKFAQESARQFRKQLEDSVLIGEFAEGPIQFSKFPVSQITSEILEEAINKALPKEPVLRCVWFVDCPEKKIRYDTAMIPVIPLKTMPENTWGLGNIPTHEFSIALWIRLLIELPPTTPFYLEEIQTRLEYVRKRPFLLKQGAWIEMSDGTWAELVV